MAVAPEDALRDLKQAARAYGDLNAELLRFQAACNRHDWEVVEEARQRCLTFLEIYLDRFRAAFQVQEMIGGGEADLLRRPDRGDQ
jgi:hypothetical protein